MSQIHRSPRGSVVSADTHENGAFCGRFTSVKRPVGVPADAVQRGHPQASLAVAVQGGDRARDALNLGQRLCGRCRELHHPIVGPGPDTAVGRGLDRPHEAARHRHRRDAPRRELVQPGLRADPDVPLAVFEERLHHVARKTVLHGNVAHGRERRVEPVPADPQAAPRGSDPDAAAPVAQEPEAVRRGCAPCLPTHRARRGRAPNRTPRAPAPRETQRSPPVCTGRPRATPRSCGPRPCTPRRSVLPAGRCPVRRASSGCRRSRATRRGRPPRWCRTGPR